MSENNRAAEELDLRSGHGTEQADNFQEAETAPRESEPEPPKGFAFERAFRSFSISVTDVRRRQQEADALRLSPEDLREVVDLFHLLNEWYEEKLR